MDHEDKLMCELQAGIAKAEAEKLIAALPTVIAVQKAIAEYQYARYSALTKAGFNEQQAMYLLLAKECNS